MKMPPPDPTETACELADQVNRQFDGEVVTVGQTKTQRRKNAKLPRELPTDAIVALIDTREQHPLILPDMEFRITGLATGDYSVAGMESEIAIERKSLPDLLACCGRDRERFDREVKRLMAYPVRALVIEADWSHIERADWRSQIAPQAVRSSLIAWQVRGLPVIMAGTRFRAGQIVAAMLRRAAVDRYRQLRELTREISLLSDED